MFLVVLVVLVISHLAWSLLSQRINNPTNPTPQWLRTVHSLWWPVILTAIATALFILIFGDNPSAGKPPGQYPPHAH
jgi:hypothetical protein